MRWSGPSEDSGANAHLSAALLAVMAREERHRGFFVALGYTADAEAECAAFCRKSERKIKLITVQEILDEQHVQKM